MPEGGKISIAIENETERLPAHFLQQKGSYIKIIVKDTGPGIPETIIDKIFDPYFTIKQSGSGLGLTIVYSIIKQHHGFIDVTSGANEGACFTIYLPSLEHIPEKEQEPDKKQYNLYQHKRLLVMDDDQNIRKTITSILHLLGYEVDTAEEGAEALAKYKQAFIDNKRYDAVILDLIVPKGMGGKETVKLLRDFDKNLCAIVSSGYSNNPVMSTYYNRRSG